MNQKFKNIILIPFISLFFFIGQSTVLSQHYYDEADSIVFDGDSAYFKFTDSEITKYIINKRWADKTIFTEEEKRDYMTILVSSLFPLIVNLIRLKVTLVS